MEEKKKDPFERKVIGPRYHIKTGTQGFYIWDAKSLDVVKKDGVFFLSKDRKEAEQLLFRLDPDAPVVRPRKF